MLIVQDELNFDYVKTRLKSIALSSYYGYDFGQFPLNISKAELSALKNLSKNRDLVILRPDKGNGVVILNKVDYIQKPFTSNEYTVKDNFSFVSVTCLGLPHSSISRKTALPTRMFYCKP